MRNFHRWCCACQTPLAPCLTRSLPQGSSTRCGLRHRLSIAFTPPRRFNRRTRGPRIPYSVPAYPGALRPRVPPDFTTRNDECSICTLRRQASASYRNPVFRALALISSLYPTRLSRLALGLQLVSHRNASRFVDSVSQQGELRWGIGRSHQWSAVVCRREASGIFHKIR